LQEVRDRSRTFPAPLAFVCDYNFAMLIKVYGELWSRHRVDWAKKNLIGVRKGKRVCNVWEQRGIYALYEHFKLVYVGQADSRGIGVRLNEHRTNRFGERWDSFSFFGICSVAEDGTAMPVGDFHVAPASVVKSLELMAILLSDAPLNRSRGKFPDGAEKVWQLDPTRPSKGFQIDHKLHELTESIEQLRRSLAVKNRRADTDEE
jgi:hypothetical protein